jgi:hypothetical protein
MIAGAVAGLLVARAHRADDPDATQSPDAKELTAPDDGAMSGTGSGVQGDDPGAAAVAPDGAGAGAGDTAPAATQGTTAADRAEKDDADAVAAGNTRGRG